MTVYDKAKNTFNKLMNANGCKSGTAKNTEKWNISDMVSECQCVLDTYYREGHENNKASNRIVLAKTYGKEKADEMHTEWLRSIRKLKTFIKTYEEFTLMEKPTEKHGSKYDNAVKE